MNPKLDYAMCIECDWNGDREECEIDYEYSEWHGRDFEFPICPKCGGGVELTNKELGDYYTDEELKEYFKNKEYKIKQELYENNKPGL